MSLKNLSDDQLKAFLSDPKAFLKNKANSDLVFDLNDATVRPKVEKYEKELGVSGRSIIDRVEAAK